MTSQHKRPLRRRAKAGAGGLAVVALIGVPLSTFGSVQAASASTQVCSDAGTHYVVSNKQGIHLPSGIDWKSGPGGTVTSSIESTQTTSLSVSMSGSFSTGAIVAQAEVTFGVDASVSQSIGSTYTYSHPVTAGKYGHVQFGNWGWAMNVRKYEVSSSTCTITSDTYGTVNRMPSANSWGFRYWETAS
ncbi:MAG TPA: hypothetical protein VFU07_03730 [Candidatus Lumbricidophila sp.]|nr:hypothetical protein [Candidatus Lumbricidophila sp.]